MHFTHDSHIDNKRLHYVDIRNKGLQKAKKFVVRHSSGFEAHCDKKMSQHDFSLLMQS